MGQTVGIAAAVASKQTGAPFTLNNFIAVCIVTELLQLLSLGRYISDTGPEPIAFHYLRNSKAISMMWLCDMSRVPHVLWVCLCSFATAAAMLSGLLLYDVFWVFGSSHVFGDNVMVTVSDSV